MRIEIRGRNVELTDDLREMVRKRFQRLGRQVSALATLDVVLSEERNPSITDSQGNTVPVGDAHVTVSGGRISFDPGTAFDYLSAGQSATVVINHVVRDPAGDRITSSWGNGSGSPRER